MSKQAASYSFPLLGILGVAFVIMKLAGIGAVASWSWWWVTAPFWGGFAIVVAFFISALMFALLAVAIGSLFRTEIKR